MILLPSTRQRIARLPLLFRAHDCLDETGLFALSYGQKVYAVFARTGYGEVLDVGGRSVLVGGGMPRLHRVWNGTARVPALLLERAGAGLFSFPDDISNAAWTKSNASATGPFAGPEGAATAYRLTENGTPGVAHYMTRGSGTISAGSEQSVVLDLKAAGRPLVKIYIADSATQANRIEARANLLTGALTLVQAVGTASNARAWVEPRAGGYHRIRLSGIPAAAATTLTAFLVMTADGVTDAYNGDGVSGVDVAHFQFEVGVQAALSKTTASTGQRLADSLYFPYRPAPREATTYVRGVEQMAASASQVTTTVLWSVTDAAGADAKKYVRRPGGSTGYRFVHEPVTVTETASVGAAATVADTVEARAILSAAGEPRLGVAINGAAEALSAVGTAQALAAAWSAQRFYFNSFGSSNVGGFAFREVAEVPGTVSLDELRDLCEVA
jgi:hypothetical protein